MDSTSTPLGVLSVVIVAMLALVSLFGEEFNSQPAAASVSGYTANALPVAQ